MIAADGAEESWAVVEDSGIGDSVEDGEVVSCGRNEVYGDWGFRGGGRHHRTRVS